MTPAERKSKRIRASIKAHNQRIHRMIPRVFALMCDGAERSVEEITIALFGEYSGPNWWAISEAIDHLATKHRNPCSGFRDAWRGRYEGEWRYQYRNGNHTAREV